MIVKVKVMRPEHLGIRDPLMLHHRGYHSGCTETGPLQALPPREMDVTVVRLSDAWFLILVGTHFNINPKQSRAKK